MGIWTYSKKIEYITDHFKKQFYKDSEKPFPEIKPQKLDNPFTINEIENAIKSLKTTKVVDVTNYVQNI